MKTRRLPEFEELIKQLFGGKVEKQITDQDFLRIRKQPNVYIFTHGKPIDAMTSLYVIELFSRKFGVIEEVVTLEEKRNKGIGSNLVETAIKKAKELGCDCVELNVREDKPEVQRFYEGLGFTDRQNKAMRLWLKKA